MSLPDTKTNESWKLKFLHFSISIGLDILPHPSVAEGTDGQKPILIWRYLLHRQAFVTVFILHDNKAKCSSAVWL
jgi:hypothetical protein